MTQLLANVFTAELVPEGNQWVESGPVVETGARFVSELAGGAVGIWGADVGQIGGVTTDEIFVVIEGRAEVTFEDTEETITIGPGDVVRLFAGQRNSWKTIEPLRKVSFYVPPTD